MSTRTGVYVNTHHFEAIYQNSAGEKTHRLMSLDGRDRWAGWRKAIVEATTMPQPNEYGELIAMNWRGEDQL